MPGAESLALSDNSVATSPEGRGKQSEAKPITPGFVKSEFSSKTGNKTIRALDAIGKKLGVKTMYIKKSTGNTSAKVPVEKTTASSWTSETTEPNPVDNTNIPQDNGKVKEIAGKEAPTEGGSYIEDMGLDTYFDDMEMCRTRGLRMRKKRLCPKQIQRRRHAVRSFKKAQALLNANS